MTIQVKRELSKQLLIWSRANKRAFPWRKTINPYKVLVAEKLLQQTSVRKSLVDAYLSLLKKYPSPEQLANARLPELREFFLSLGLPYRAKDLILMAKDITEGHGGEIPSDLSSLLSIYGVGDYSARAVLSFAFGKDLPVVDTNVARILYRVFAIPGKFPTNPARSRKLIEIAQSLVPPGKSKQFNWAMIDLGALICSPSKPLCDECPINYFCEYARNRS
jgi:A/G-specific adenine glycosylase